MMMLFLFYALKLSFFVHGECFESPDRIENGLHYLLCSRYFFG
jgi:hypothetical protein